MKKRLLFMFVALALMSTGLFSGCSGVGDKEGDVILKEVLGEDLVKKDVVGDSQTKELKAEDTKPEGIKVSPEKIAVDITAELLAGFQAATEDGTLELGSAVEVSFATIKTGLKASGKWDEAVKGGMTIGAIVDLAQASATAALMAANIWELPLYTPETPHAELANTLANKLSSCVLESFADGVVTVGDIYKWPTEVTKLALEETGLWDKAVGSVHPDVEPMTVGQIFTAADGAGELILKMMNVEDYPLFCTK